MLQEKRVKDYRLAVLSTVIVLLTILSTYLATRVHATYQNTLELGQLRSSLEIRARAQEGRDKAEELIIEQLARTVWAGDDKPKEPRRQSIIEVYQANNDKIIKQRMTAMEYRLLAIEGKLDKLQDKR